MPKIIISSFGDRQSASDLLLSAADGGFDPRCFSIISSSDTASTPLRSLMPNIPAIQARLYQKHLLMGDSLLVAQVSEDDVPGLIRLLQSRGGQLIEAFDQVNVA